MQPERATLTLLYALAAVLAGIAGWLVWRRGVAASRPLALMIFSSAFWSFCDILELNATQVATKRMVSQVQYLSGTCVAPLFLLTALALSHKQKYLNRAVQWAIWTIPAATLAFAWTSQWHSWLWTSVTIPNPVTRIAVYRYGWWFWVFVAHSWVLFLLGTLLILEAVRKVGASFRAAMMVVIAAVLLPWFGNLAYDLKLGPWIGVDWFSISLSISGIMLAWSTLRGGLYDLLPSAREALIEHMADGVFVLDHTGSVLLINTAARRIFPVNESRAAVLPSVLAERLPDLSMDTWEGEVELPGTNPTNWVNLRATRILDRWGEPAGRLLMVRDVTAQKTSQKEKDDLIARMQAALNQVRTLEGLLPVCAWCRRIRDDQGYWSNVETYLSEHTKVRFTHGICQECVKTRLH